MQFLNKVVGEANTDLMKSIQRFHESMVEERAMENEVRNAPRSPLANVKDELIKDAIQSELVQYAKDLEHGYQILVREYMEEQKRLAQQGLEHEDVSRFFIPREKIQELKESGELMKWIRDGIPLYSLLGLSPDAIYEVYMIVMRLLDAGEERVLEALSVVRLLLTLVPYVADFWHLYGVCLFRNHLYEHVINACDQALRLDPRCYDAALLLIRTLRDLGRRGEADARLGSFLEDAQRRSDPAAVQLFMQARYQMGR